MPKGGKEDTTLVCRKCQERKSIKEFSWRPDAQSYRKTCKDCRRDSVNAASRRRYAKNAEKQKKYGIEYRKKNPDKVKAWQRERQVSGRSTKATYKWRENNPEAWAQVNHRYRARLHATSFENTSEYRSILKKDPCSYCGSEGKEVDHIDPLILGGTETNDNLTSACKSCNSRKRDKPMLLWMASRA